MSDTHQQDSDTRVNGKGRIAFVPARFGEGIVGGAEIVLHQQAKRLQERGWEVEVLTTTALDHHTWHNVLPPGKSSEDGLHVHRFPAVYEPSPGRAALEAAILEGHRLSIADQQRWMNLSMRSPELWHHLLDHGDEYRAVMFTPYPTWLAYAGSQLLPERSVLWTCLHDEPYAYLDLFQPVFTGVAGLLLQTEPEHELAHRVAGNLAPHEVVGCGVEIPSTYDPDGFRERYGIKGRFLLYAGRREGAKGWENMLEQFARATERRGLPFSLVTMGGGEVKPPTSIADRVIDVGFLPDDERDNAFAAADAYIQPSQYEAFSRTVMEAWLAGTLVIANGASDVVAYHCERSGAGLVYDDEFELEEALGFLADAPEAAAEIAARGRDYVVDNYSWDVVIDNIERAVLQWTSS